MKYVSDKGAEWIPVLMIQLLSSLSVLHQQGWIFGDLKPDNLIVTGPPARIRCIDVGGTTKEGRAIKEYTEFYDRGYWGYGTRKAEPSYDLFAVAMIMINSVHKKNLRKQTSPKNSLGRSLKETHCCISIKVLFSALNGEYQSADEMKQDMLDAGKKQYKENNLIKTSPQPAARQRQQNLVKEK